MEGTIGIIFAVCAILLTLAVIGAIIAFVRTLGQIQNTVGRMDEALRRSEPLINEAELAIQEWRQIGVRVSNTAESAEHLAQSFEGFGTKAAQAGKVVLSGIGGPVGRTMAMMNAFKIGTDVFFRLAGKSRKDDPKRDGGRAKQIESGKSETQSSKEVGSES